MFLTFFVDIPKPDSLPPMTSPPLEPLHINNNSSSFSLSSSQSTNSPPRSPLSSSSANLLSPLTSPLSRPSPHSRFPRPVITPLPLLNQKNQQQQRIDLAHSSVGMMMTSPSIRDPMFLQESIESATQDLNYLLTEMISAR